MTQKKIFRCKHCKTLYFYPKDCTPDNYCEFCRARGKKRKIIEILDNLKCQNSSTSKPKKHSSKKQ